MKINKENGKSFWAGMSKTIPQLLVTAAVINICAPTFSNSTVYSAEAAAAATDGGGKARINLTEELAIFSQSTAASACYVSEGFDAKHETEMLKKEHDTFVNILHALEFGDPHLGVPTAEHYSKAIKAIRKIHETWTHYDEAVMAIVAGKNITENAKYMSEHNEELLHRTEMLASFLEAEHTNPNEAQLSDATAIIIAKRQNILSQKLKMEACLIEGNHADEKVMQDYEETIQLYESSLTALHDGFPAAGVRPPPNEEIKYELEEARKEWDATKILMKGIHSGSDHAEEEMIALDKAIDILDRRMHLVSTEYLLSTPGSEDIYELPMLDYMNSTLMSWITDPALIAAVNDSNAKNANLKDDDLHKLEVQWEAELKSGSGPLMASVEEEAVSKFLREKQDDTHGIVTEAFIMNNKGMNVAESEPTAEYWHQEDDRWKLTYGNRSGDTHISEIHLEEGGHTYQSQISVPIYDPATNKMIGAATFGINVQSMF